MNIKITPKDANCKINELIFEGHKIIAFIRKDHKIKRATSKYNEADDIKIYRQEFDKWYDKATKNLLATYDDYAPLYHFINPPSNAMVDTGVAMQVSNILNMLELRLDILYEYYTDINRLLKAPLFYIESKSYIMYYDIACPLKHDSNQSELCKFLFRKSIGEYSEKEDIWKYIQKSEAHTFIKGNNDYNPKVDSDTINNAVEGINRNTSQTFGFRIIESKKIL